MIISEILGHYNQGVPTNLHFKFFRLDLFVKEFYRVVKILHNYSGLSRNNGLLNCNIFVISLKKNVIFVKLFETSLGSDIPFLIY